MEKIPLMKAVLTLFKQNLTREQIADELKIDVKKLDEEMDLFFSNPVLIQEKEPEKSNLPFDFDEKLELLNTNIFVVINDHKVGFKSQAKVKIVKLIEMVFREKFDKGNRVVYLHECLERQDMFSLPYHHDRLIGEKTIYYFKEMLKANGIDLPNSITFTEEQQKRLL